VFCCAVLLGGQSERGDAAGVGLHARSDKKKTKREKKKQRTTTTAAMADSNKVHGDGDAR